ncbi:cyclophilin-like fold protein [Neobacillus drentensis]
MIINAIYHFTGDPSVGDFTYYSPWGNLAIFYRDFN